MLPLQPVSNRAWITLNLQNQIVQIWLCNRDSQRYPRLEAAATVYCLSEPSSQQAALYSKCRNTMLPGLSLNTMCGYCTGVCLTSFHKLWLDQCSQQASPAVVLKSLGQSGRNQKSLQMPRPSPQMPRRNLQMPR